MEILESLNEIQIFDEFKKKLETLKYENEKAVFIYESQAGNKAARSHIYKLRQTKSAVEKARKEAKQGVLEYGRRLDAFANEIKCEIDSMIHVHETPLLEIEQREKDRVDSIQARIQEIYDYCGEFKDGAITSVDCKSNLEIVKAIVIDDSFQEFKDEAEKAKIEIIDRLDNEYKKALDREELERLREEKRKREEEEAIQRRIKEAEQKAKEEAEKQAIIKEQKAKEREEKQRAEALERERQQKLALERAEKQIVEAEKKAIEAERLAKEKAESEHKAKAEREKLELKKREENKRHVKNIHKDISDDFSAMNDLTANQIKAIVKLITEGNIRHLKVIY